MKVLILGSGGREHTLAWKISQSTLCSKIFVAPGNAGTQNIAENIDIDPLDFPALADFSIKNKIEISTGIPKPPFLIIAPSGAPIKNMITQAADWVYFRNNSIS